MENAVEALKIAFAVMMFVMALTLSISSFSQATSAVTSIVNMNDREIEYTYVQPSEKLTRTVGVETIVPSLYRAYKENIEIYFFKSNGEPLILYYETDITGKRVKENGYDVGINYIDLSLENFATAEEAINHLDTLLGVNPNTYTGKYKNQLNKNYPDGLYAFLSKYSFEEELGEYYQGTGSTKIKKRVITYTIKP